MCRECAGGGWGWRWRWGKTGVWEACGNGVDACTPFAKRQGKTSRQPASVGRYFLTPLTMIFAERTLLAYPEMLVWWCLVFWSLCAFASVFYACVPSFTYRSFLCLLSYFYY